jgi:D-alanyl-D-alanine carboxypeptidase
MRRIALFVCAALLFAPPAAAEFHPSLDRLSESEITLSRSIVNDLSPLVEERRKNGTAPMLTFDEIYAPLSPEQRAFLDTFRAIDPAGLNGASRRLPLPSGERFVRLEGQLLLRDGKPVPVDAQYLPEEVYLNYRRMMAAMEEDLGKRLLVESGYRSPAYQLYLFLFYMPNHGYSIRETNRHVALPGCSEHGSPARQAIDFITPGGINGEERPEEFEELQEYGWLLNRAREFGFHLSYPRGGTSAYEPWHWHYEAKVNEG